MNLNECLLTDTSILAEYEDMAAYNATKTKQQGIRKADVFIVVLALVSIGVFAFVLAGGKAFSNLSEGVRYAVVSLAVVLAAGCVSGIVCRVALIVILEPLCCPKCGNGRQEIRDVVETLFCDYVFSSQVLDQFMSEKTRGLLNKQSLEWRVKRALDSKDFKQIVEDSISAFFRSPEGIGFEALGYTKESVTPIVYDALQTLILRHSGPIISAVCDMNMLKPHALAVAARSLLISRCQNVDNKLISETLVSVVGININVIVSVSVMIGAVLAVAARLVAFFSGTR